jgi:hypothetical protein
MPQAMFFGYWAIDKDKDTYVDISSRCWSYFTGLVGLGFGEAIFRAPDDLLWSTQYGHGAYCTTSVTPASNTR